MNEIIIPVALSIHNFTTPIFFLAFCLVVAFFLWIKHLWLELVVWTVAVASTVFAVQILKYLFAVPRPIDALVVLSDPAFPSGHAASSFCVAVLATWIAGDRTPSKKMPIGIFFFLLAAIISYSRIAIFVHTVPQVVAGAAAGILVPLAVILLAKRK